MINFDQPLNGSPFGLAGHTEKPLMQAKDDWLTWKMFKFYLAGARYTNDTIELSSA
jgi:hypothetical protein